MSALAMRSALAPTAALVPRTRVARRTVRAASVRASAGSSDGPGYSGLEEKLFLEPIKKIEGVVTLPRVQVHVQPHPSPLCPLLRARQRC